MPHSSLAELFRIGTGAHFAVINRYRSDRDVTITVAIAGDGALVRFASRVLNFDIFAGGWRVDQVGRRLLSEPGFIHFGSLADVAGGQLPAAALHAVERATGIKSVYGRRLHSAGETHGNVVVFFATESVSPETCRRLDKIAAVVEDLIADTDSIAGVYAPEAPRGELPWRTDGSEGAGDGTPITTVAPGRIPGVELFDFVPDIYVGVDHELRIVFANEAVREFGVHREASLGKPVSSLVAADDASTLENDLRSLLPRDGSPAEERTHSTVSTTLLSRKRRRFRLVASRVAATNPETGEVLSLVFRDVTKEHQLAMGVVQREEALRQLADAMAEAVWIETIVPGDILYMNDNVASLTGIDRREIVRDPAVVFRTFETTATRTDGNGHPGAAHASQVEYELPLRDGSSRWVRIRSYPIEKPDCPLLMVRIASDITGERRIRESIEKQQAEMRFIVSEMSHRVKNQLNMVAALSQIASAQASDPATRQEFARIEQGLRSVAFVHEQLHRNPDSDTVDLAHYCNRLLSVMSPVTADGTVIRVVGTIAPVVVPAPLSVVVGLLINELVTNATKHAFPPEWADPTIVVSIDGDAGAQDTEKAEQGVSEATPGARKTGPSSGSPLPETRMGCDTTPEASVPDKPSEAPSITIEVRDNGVHLAADPTSGSQSSMGMTIVHTLAAQMGGTLSFRQGPVWKTFTVRTKPEAVWAPPAGHGP